MGQRHQVYIRLPKKFYNEGNCNNRPERTVGWHNQWSYGSLPLRNVMRIVDYMSKQGHGGDKGFQGAITFGCAGDLTYVMSFDAEAGNVSRYYPMGKVDSHYGDDLERQTDENDVLEDPRLGDNNDGITVLDFTPCVKGLPPTYAFVSVYGLEGRDGVAITPLKPLSAAEYLGAYYAPDADDMPPDAAALLAKFDGLKVITLARLKKIFPKMYRTTGGDKK